MDNQVFTELRQLIYSTSGISLSDDKRPLLANRIYKRLRHLGIESAADYLKTVLNDSSGAELNCLLDAISTNVTYFYREKEHFERLTEIIKEHRKKVGQKLRIWCAASSSGEEPYTITMTVLEALGGGQVDFKLLATDLNTTVLKQAIKGVYLNKDIRNVPVPILKTYFSKSSNASTDLWQIKDFLKQYVIFRRLNLIETPYPISGPVDVIFCRNVMIYFDQVVRKKVVDEMYRLLRPGGYLIVSKSENLLGLDHKFKSSKDSVYQKL